MLSRVLSALCLPALLTVLMTGAALASEGDGPLGVWIDDSGQGAIEIKDCGGKLCGQVVWLKSARNAGRCNLAVIGDLSASGEGKWSGGWIYDPASKARFNVEITPVGSGKLEVMGYAGSKSLSRTMTWTRAPEGLKRCNDASPAIEATLTEPMKTPSVPKAARSRQGDAGSAVAARPASRSIAGHRVAASDKSGKRNGGTVKLAELSAYGLQHITLRKSRGACSLKVSDFANLAFPC